MKYILLLTSFFIIQTYYPNEYLLLSLLILISIYLLYESKWSELNLYILGLVLGFIIEYLMGLVSRSQYWINTSILPIPLWLPFAWAFGFIVIRRIGNRIVKE